MSMPSQIEVNIAIRIGIGAGEAAPEICRIAETGLLNSLAEGGDANGCIAIEQRVSKDLRAAGFPSTVDIQFSPRAGFTITVDPIARIEAN